MTTVLCLIFAGAMIAAGDARAQSMGDYTSVPPFVGFTAGAPPNVLISVDTSSSMNRQAHQDIDGGQGEGKWSETHEYPGLFNPLECYTYDSTNKRFEPSGAARSSLSATCPTSKWDGNFLNYVSTRRIDIPKLAMIGGACIDTATDTLGYRNTDLTCTPSGSPAKMTVTGQFTRDREHSDPVSTGTGANRLDGRVPSSLQTGISSMYFHLAGPGMYGAFCADDDSTGPGSSSSCSDSDGYAEQVFYIRAVVDETPVGVVQELEGRARIGLIAISDDAQGRVIVPIGLRQHVNFTQDSSLGTTITTLPTNTAAVIDSLDKLINDSGSPIIEGLYQSIRYYAQLPSASYTGAFLPLGYSPGVALGATGNGSIGPGEIDVLTGSETCSSGYITDACGRDPHFYGSDHAPAWAKPSAQVACCKNYVILFSDGGVDSSNLPASLQTYADSIHGNTSSDYDMVSVAYWGHVNDLRQATVPVISESGHDVPGDQTVTTYAFFSFGGSSGRDLMIETAKYGGFEDENGNQQPDLTSEWDKINNQTGAAGADGLPDTFYEFQNVKELKTGLTVALNLILLSTGAGSAASVLASSSSGAGAIYQSYFDPKVTESSREIKWVGYMQSLFIDPFGNLRQDNGDAHLVYTDDKIIRMRFDENLASATFGEVVVDRYSDADGNGLPDSATPDDTVLLKDITPLWEAGNKLAGTASSARKLFTWIDKNNDGVVDADERIRFDNGDGGTDNTALLTPYLNPGAAPFTATNLISFIRGQQVAGMRDRELTVGGSLKVWKLGDAIHASPVVVASPAQRYDLIYGDISYSAFFNEYKDRRHVVYLGANDGMLHAFNAGYFHRGDDPGTTGTDHGYFTKTPDGTGVGKDLGTELFAFIPQELLPHLKWLSDPGYSHVYYADLTPKAVDVRIFCDAGGGAPAACVNGQGSASHPQGWGTILIGGFRLGGSCGACVPGTGATPMTLTADFDYDAVTAATSRTFYSAYFVLDVTDPEQDPRLLWSFSSADLGLTTSVPSVLRVSPASDAMTDPANAKWYMVMGSGPTGYDGSVAQSGKLFAFDLVVGPETGATKDNDQVTTLGADTLNTFLSSTLTLDRDLDYRVDATYAGGTIDDSAPPWRGKLYRLTMNSCATPCLPNTWGFDEGGSRAPSEILSTFDSGALKLGPVTARPSATLDNSSRVWLFAGTGRYFDQGDGQSTDQQYFVGVKDSVLNGLCTESTRTNCHDDDLVDVSAAQVCLIGTGSCGTTTDQVQGVTGATTFPSLIALIASLDGWYTTLPTARERALFQPVVFGGLVLFPTFVPGASGVCDATTIGESSLYALYYMTGSAYSSPVIGTSGSGTEYVKRSTSLGSGMTSQAVMHVGKDAGSGKMTGYVQKSTGELTSIEVNSVLPITSRVLSWYDARL